MTGLMHEHRISVPGTPEQVFAAFTDPAALRHWFAESVEIEPRLGGAFRFWGRNTYGAPKAGSDRQRITEFKPPHELGFVWDIEGAAGNVVVGIQAGPVVSNGAATSAVTVRHSFAVSPSVPKAKHMIDDMWRFTVANLLIYMRGDDRIVRPDFGDPHPEVRISIVIDAPRERVFRALMEPDALRRWLGATAPEVDARAGGRYSYGWEYEIEGRKVTGGPTHIIELVPNERLVTNWPDWRCNPDKPDTQVTWTLESIGASQTRVTLVHSGFARTADMSDYAFGWADFAAALKAEVEQSR